MAHVSDGNSRSPPQRHAILILGMQRSGASALAGVVRSLGAAAPKTLLMPSSGNPSGYWESVPLATAHDELLASAGLRWNDWRQINPQWIHSTAAQRYKERIKDILLDEYGDAPLSVIKDPRVCRFVPFMSDILSEMKIETVAFLMLRNPLEIALSLRRRGGIAVPRGLMLWLRHVLDAEHHSRGMLRYFLTYEDLLMDWRRHLDRAAEKFGIVWPARSDTSAAAIEQFLSLDLNHERGGFKTLDKHPDVSPLVSDAYRILWTMAADGESQELLDQIDLLRRKFEEGCEIHGPMTMTEELAIEQLRGEIGQRTAESERLRASLEQQRIQWTQHDANARRVHELNQRLGAELSALRDAFAQKDTDNQRLGAELSAFRDALTQKDTDNQRLAADLSTSEKQLETLRAAIAQQTDDLQKSELQNAELQAALAGYQVENRSLRDQFDLVYRSRSWRMTKPLRAISLFFRRNGVSTRRE